MCEEFEVNNLVDQLITNLGSSLNPEEGLECLSAFNERTIKINDEEYKELALRLENPNDFVKKYEELAAKKIDVLEPYTQLLSYLNTKKKVGAVLNKRMLKMAAAQSNPLSSANSVNIEGPEQDVLIEVKSRLNKCVNDIDRKKALDSSLVEHKSLIPEFTRWKEVRPFMSHDFPFEHVENYCLPLGGVPSSSQEYELIEDLLCVLMGFQGKFILAQPITSPYAERVFHISTEIESSLGAYARLILPLASYHSFIERFIEERRLFKWGRVNQALCAAFDSYVTDYWNFLCALESEHRKCQLNLSKLFVLVQTSLYSMELMANVANTISKAEARGGRTLSLLHDEVKNFVGHKDYKNICLNLIQKACVPYFESLDYWIHLGQVFDPLCDEFMIVDNISIEKLENDDLDGKYSEDYWVQRYIIKNDYNVPSFLEGVKDKILRTGKYLNVIRQCKASVQLKSAKEKQKQMKYMESSDNCLIGMIDEAYQFASSSLLNLLMKDYDLVNRIRSIKRYFLLEQGDFIVILLDLCETELMKPIAEVVPGKLESLLDLALRLSSGGKADPYKENICMDLMSHQLNFQIFTILTISTVAENDYKKPDLNKSLTGLEAFSLGLSVEWPLSLIFNQKIIGCYQMLFRHLLLCKHVERQLCNVWLCQKSIKTASKSTREAYLKSFALRQQMLFCIQNLEYYMMEEVIESNYTQFIRTLHETENIKNIDDVMEKHWTYLSQCMKECMLTSPVLMRTVKQIITCCVQFCDYIQRIQSSSCDSSFPDSGGVLSRDEQFESKISQYSEEFSHTLLGLLEAITQMGQDDKGDRLYNILYRENFSGYHSKDLDHRLASKVTRKNTYKKERPTFSTQATS
ncbi:hypothetical protein WDU94_011390 [Cyamophila willieti]